MLPPLLFPLTAFSTLVKYPNQLSSNLFYTCQCEAVEFMLRFRLGKEVGGDQRRPVSQASTTCLAFPWRLLWTHQFFSSAGTQQSQSIQNLAAPCFSGETRVVSRALRSVEQWQSVRHNFQATSVRPVLWHKVQIPHTFVVFVLRRHCPKRMPGDSTQEGREDGHTDRSEKGGRACQTRRRSGTRKREESNRECGVV